MKRFLKNKLNLIIFVFALFSIIGNVEVASKTEYYLRQFKKWAQVEKREEIFTDLNLDENADYLLVLTSQLNSIENQELITNDFTGRNIFVVCDERINIGNNNHCSYDSVSTENNIVLHEEEGLLKGSSVQIGRQEYLDNQTYFIPEMYLVTPDLKDHVSDYFKQFFKKSPAFIQESVDELPPKIVKAVKDVIQTPIFEAFTYAAVLLGFAVILRGFILNLSNNPEDFTKPQFYKNILNRFISFFEEYSWLFNFSLIMGALGFIPILILISILDKGTIDISYMIKYLVETLDAQSLVGFVSQQSETRLLLFTYVIFFLALVVLSILPQILKIFLRSFSLIFKKQRINPDVKWIPAVLISLSVVMSSYSPIQESYIWITYFVLISFYFVYLLESSNLETRKSFSLKEKVLILLVTILLFGIGFGFKYRQESMPIEYAYESLIKVDDNIVLFPYNKDFKGPTLFKEFIYTGDAPVFVQNYLVFYPGFTEIKNRNINEFSVSENFVIQNSGQENVFREILSNETLRGYLITDQFSQVIYLENFDADSDSNYAAELVFECGTSLPNSELKLAAYSHEGSEDETIFTFPGCSPEDHQELIIVNTGENIDGNQEDNEQVVELEESTTISYQIPFDPFSIFTDKLLFDFRLENQKVAKAFSEIRIYKDGREVNFDYVNYGPNENILVENVENTNDEFYFYSFDLEKEMDFGITSLSEFDLSQLINKLQKEDLLPNPFTIWSTKEHAVLKN